MRVPCLLGKVADPARARRAAGLASNNLEASLQRAMHEPRRGQRDRLQAVLVADGAVAARGGTAGGAIVRGGGGLVFGGPALGAGGAGGAGARGADAATAGGADGVRRAGPAVTSGGDAGDGVGAGW